MECNNVPVSDTGTIRRVGCSSKMIPMQFSAEDYEESLILRKRAAEAQKEKMKDEDYKCSLDWINANNARRVQGAGGTAAGTETVLRPRQEDLDIASLQHNGVSDKQK